MKRNGKDIVALYAFNFLKNLQFFGAVAVPFYLHRIGLDYRRMFILEMAFSAAMMAFEVPTGIVADRWGRRISLCLGSSFLALGFFMFGIFHAFTLLFAAELICALGMPLVSGADKALLYETMKRSEAPEESTTVFARYEAAGTAGLFISFPLGSLFAGSGIVPYKSALGLVFVATAAALAISGLVVLRVKETAPSPGRAGFMKQGIDGFLYIFKTTQLRRFGINYAVISALTFFMFWFYQSLLALYGVPVAWFGFAGSAFNLSAMLLLRATPAVRSRLGIDKTLFLSSLLPGLLYLAAGLLPGLAIAVPAMFGIISLKLFRAPMLSALMNERIGDANRATVLSGISMIERVLIAILYPIIGVVADLSLPAVMLALGALTILSSFALSVGDASLQR